jgi:hypothetical protein
MTRNTKPRNERADRQHETISAARISGRYAVTAAAVGAVLTALLTALLTNGFGLFSAKDSSSASAPSASLPTYNQNSHGPSSAAQSRRVTFPETTGGVAHTWTNYTTGGGEQGPVIGAYATVQVSCRISGLQVKPDNNPWWYLVASAPWNDKFYVSADAFYNDGQVTGSLLNTPWFDKRVHKCT